MAFLVLAFGGLTPSLAQTAADPVTKTFSAPLVLQALRNSYPGLLTNIRLVVGSWEFDVAGKTFVWAEGRLLPKERAGQWLAYSPQPFYQYTSKPPAVESWTRDQELAVEKQLRTRNNTTVLRDGSFFDALWGIRNRGEADSRQKRLTLFGLPVTVHENVVASLKKVEAAVKLSTDKETKDFLASLRRLEGFNWRDIAGTQSRSNHAYGTALDLIPRTYGGKAVYWLWSMPREGTNHWYKWTWLHRWVPPKAVVAAFEEEGWVWGGKWMLFDTIHFEYRPEILALNGLR